MTTEPHTNFEHAFTIGHVVERDDETLRIDVVPAGTLVAKAGEWLHAVDPAVESSVVELAYLAPGEYRVDVSRVTGTHRETGRTNTVTAALRVHLGSGDVAQWYDRGTLGVDTGRAAFATTTFLNEDSDPLLTDPNAVFDRVANGSAVVVQSAFGDGGYGCWVGHDANGNAVQAIIDFVVF